MLLSENETEHIVKLGQVGKDDMASTQAEPEVPRNGPDGKDVDGPVANSNGVDSQTGRAEVETNSTNGPPPQQIGSHNNGAHDGINETNKLTSSGYGFAKPTASFEQATPYESTQQPPYGYSQHGYSGISHHHPQHPQADHIQANYPGYPHSNQYPSGQGNSMIRSATTPIASKPAAYMNSLQPRPGGPVPGYPVHGGQYPSPSRYPTPTLNQLLQPQPGPGASTQQYPYGEYLQQPSTQTGVWPGQQQQRTFTPGAGFKPSTHVRTFFVIPSR